MTLESKWQGLPRSPQTHLCLLYRWGNKPRRGVQDPGARKEPSQIRDPLTLGPQPCGILADSDSSATPPPRGVRLPVSRSVCAKEGSGPGRAPSRRAAGSCGPHPDRSVRVPERGSTCRPLRHWEMVQRYSHPISSNLGSKPHS